MTVTDIRTRRTAEPTVESAELAALDAEIAALTAKLKDPQGCGDWLEAERTKLLSLRAELHTALVELAA